MGNILSILDQASSLGVPSIGNDFLVANLELLSNNSIRIWYTRAPQLGTNKANDAYSYSITGPQSVTIKLATTWINDSRAIDLYFDKDLIVGQWTLSFVSNNIVSNDTQASTLPTTTYRFTLGLANKTIVNLDTDSNLTRKVLNPAFLKTNQKNWRALESTLEDNRTNLADTVNKIADQLYISTASSKYLNIRASNNGIVHSPILGLTDELYRQLTITILNDKLTNNAYLDLLEVIYGPESVRAFIQSSKEEFYRLFDKATLNILVDGKTLVPVVFNWSDFKNCLQATAQEVCFIINSHFSSFRVTAFAVPYTDIESNKTYIRIYSGTKGLKSSIAIISGSSQLAFNFDSVICNTLGPALIPIPQITIAKQTLNKATIRINRSEIVTQELLDNIVEGDYLNIIGSEFNAHNRGSFIVELVTTYSTYTLLTVTNKNAVNETVTILTNNSLIFYRSVTKQIFDNVNYAYVTNNSYNFSDNHLGFSKASIPVNTNIIVRDITNAAYLSNCIETELDTFYRRPDGNISISGYSDDTLVEIQDFIAKIPDSTDLSSKLFSYTTSDSFKQLALPLVLSDLNNRIIVIGGKIFANVLSANISVLTITEALDTDLSVLTTATWSNNSGFSNKILGLGMSATVLDYPRFYNKVLITGGFTNDVNYNSNASYIYSSDDYTLTTIADSNPHYNADAALVWIRESKLAVLIGGVDQNGNATNSFSIWNPAYNSSLGQWSHTSDNILIEARTNCQAIEINDGKVLVVGGRVNSNSDTFALTNIGTPLNSCEIIQPGNISNSYSWNNNGLQAPPSPDTYTWDPNNGLQGQNDPTYSWNNTNGVNYTNTSDRGAIMACPMAYSRFAFGMVKLPDNRILVVGGIGGKVSQVISPTGNIIDHELNSCEIYDPGTGIWSLIDNTNDKHSYCTCYYDSITNRVYVYGGLKSTKVEYLDLETFTWHYSTANMATSSFRGMGAGVTLKHSSIIVRLASTYNTSEDNNPTQIITTYNEDGRANGVNGINNINPSGVYNWNSNGLQSPTFPETYSWDAIRGVQSINESLYTWDNGGASTISPSDISIWTKNQPGTTFKVNTISAQ